jgi:hypothetical protein
MRIGKRYRVNPAEIAEKRMELLPLTEKVLSVIDNGSVVGNDPNLSLPYPEPAICNLVTHAASLNPCSSKVALR